MALDSQKKIVPQQIILNGNASDVFLNVVKSDGTKVFSVFGDGKLSFFNKAGVAQAAAVDTESADSSYGAPEQAMLQKCYDVLKAVGLIA